MEQDAQVVVLTFADDRSDDDVGLSTVGELLALLQALYTHVRSQRSRFDLEDLQGATDELRKSVAALEPEEIEELFRETESQVLLRASGFSRRSPWALELGGWLGALAIIVSVCGGKLKVQGGFEFECPGLSSFVEAMKSLFPSSKTLGYGPQGMTVVLSVEELEFLLSKKDSMAGGWQRRWTNWKQRVDQKTRRLDLTSKDVDHILKYGGEPAGGTFQKDIRKLFNRHFDWEAAS